MKSSDLLKRNLEAFMGMYLEAKFASRYGRSSDVVSIFRSVVENFSSLSFVENRGLTVSGSLGRGDWAHIPWIAFLDPRETITITKGFYPAIFFHMDMKTLTLALAQGSGSGRANASPGVSAAQYLRRSAERLDSSLVLPEGFSRNPLDLGSERPSSKAYEAGTVFYKSFAIPVDQTGLVDGLNRLVVLYQEAIENSLRHFNMKMNEVAKKFPISEPSLLMKRSIEFCPKNLENLPASNSLQQRS